MLLTLAPGDTTSAEGAALGESGPIRARILQVAIKRGKAAPTGSSGTALASLLPIR